MANMLQKLHQCFITVATIGLVLCLAAVKRLRYFLVIPISKRIEFCFTQTQGTKKSERFHSLVNDQRSKRFGIVIR